MQGINNRSTWQVVNRNLVADLGASGLGVAHPLPLVTTLTYDGGWCPYYRSREFDNKFMYDVKYTAFINETLEELFNSGVLSQKGIQTDVTINKFDNKILYFTGTILRTVTTVVSPL